MRSFAKELYRGVAFALAMTLISAGAALAATIVVPNGGSIQAAVNAASDGDTIEIAAGTFVEQVTVEGKSLTIIGAGQAQTIIQAPAKATRALKVVDYGNPEYIAGRNCDYVIGFFGDPTTPTCTLMSLTVDGNKDMNQSVPKVNAGDPRTGMSAAIVAFNCNFHMEDVLDINSQEDTAFGAQQIQGSIFGSKFASVTQRVKNCTFTDWQKTGVAVYGFAPYKFYLENCTVIANGPTGATAQNTVNFYYVQAFVFDNLLRGSFYTGTYWGASGGLFFYLAPGSQLVGNQIEGNQLSWVLAGTNGALVADNTFDANMYGLWLGYVYYGGAGDASNNNTIIGNTFSNNLYTGLDIDGSSSNTISGNNFVNTNYGLNVWDNAGTGNSANGNSFNGNEGADIWNDSPNPLDAQGNYFGDPAGPQVGGAGAGAVDTSNELFQPVSNDPDGDGLTNAQEAVYGTDPNDPDTDGDGVSDGVEVALGRNPLVPEPTVDNDNDGLPQPVDPDDNNPDTDGDKYADGYEVAMGTDPSDPNSKPVLGDVNGNGRIDNVDAIITFQASLGALSYGDFITLFQRMDVDLDGDSDYVDAIAIFDIFLGVQNLLPR